MADKKKKPIDLLHPRYLDLNPNDERLGFSSYVQGFLAVRPIYIYEICKALAQWSSYWLARTGLEGVTPPWVRGVGRPSWVLTLRPGAGPTPTTGWEPAFVYQRDVVKEARKVITDRGLQTVPVPTHLDAILEERRQTTCKYDPVYYHLLSDDTRYMDRYTPGGLTAWSLKSTLRRASTKSLLDELERRRAEGEL